MNQLLTAEEKEYARQVCQVLSPLLVSAVAAGVEKALEAQTKIEYQAGGVDLQPIMNSIKTSAGLPLDERLHGLVGEFDASVWAKAFKKLNPPTDEATMLGWFANAIMAGYDHAKKEARAKLKPMQDSLNIQGSNGNWDTNHYMFGMFNGMEHMLAIAEDREPQFRSWPENKPLPNSIPGAEAFRSPDEVEGERAVWAQAYAATIQNYEPVLNDPNRVHETACKSADQAVKVFRERYK